MSGESFCPRLTYPPRGRPSGIGVHVRRVSGTDERGRHVENRENSALHLLSMHRLHDRKVFRFELNVSGRDMQLSFSVSPPSVDW
jgi:hypothetical protein